MGSAEGQVQQMRYNATFPLLLNIAEQPTYFMALKDASSLVKMYAMVNVSQYQIVATGSSVMECETNYRTMLAKNGLIGEEQAEVAPTETAELHEISGVIQEIRSAVIEGNTYFYFSLRAGDTDGGIVRASAATNLIAPLLSVGDEVTVSYRDVDVGLYWIDAYDILTD